MTDKKTVLSKKVVGRRRALADSDDSSTECEKELLLPSSSTDFCRNCCTCNNPRVYKAKSREKQQLSSVDSHLSRTSYREQLETKVLNEQVSHQVSSEQWRHLENQLFRLNEASFILNTLFNSVHVTSTCLSRLANLLSDHNNGFDERCEEICDKINYALETTRDADIKPSDETVDFLSKKSNLTKASTNFADILRRSSVPTNKQLSKLEKQYDDIRCQYVDAKSKALLKINGSIQKKMENLNDQLHKYLIPVLSITSDFERQIINCFAESSVDMIKKRLETSKSWTMTPMEKNSNSHNVGVCSNGGAGDGRRRNCTCCDSSN